MQRYAVGRIDGVPDTELSFKHSGARGLSPVLVVKGKNPHSTKHVASVLSHDDVAVGNPLHIVAVVQEGHLTALDS